MLYPSNNYLIKHICKFTGRLKQLPRFVMLVVLKMVPPAGISLGNLKTDCGSHATMHFVLFFSVVGNGTFSLSRVL